MMNTRTSSVIQFHDAHPEPANFYAEVINGLHSKPKMIPPKFFYDEIGSQLFDDICETPEYYPTRTELGLLRQYADEIASLIGKDCLLVEPGSGSSQKVRLLLDSLQPAAYIPMDISRDYLVEAARKLSAEYPWLHIHASCLDFTSNISLPQVPRHADKLAFFPGSSIGNFEPHQAVGFLSDIAELIGSGGSLLIGVDLKKDHDTLNAAYNDNAGLTAAFNLNLLTRINRELGAAFELDRFSHKALYNEDKGRMEMHLVSSCDQLVPINNELVEFSRGETIHTENSYKYTIDEFSRLADQAGLKLLKAWVDDDRLFSLQYYTCG